MRRRGDFAQSPDRLVSFSMVPRVREKTHLAAAIVNAIVERGEPAKYVSALDVPDLIRNERFEDDDGAEGGSFASLMDAPVLVIDDFGAQQATNWIDWKFDQLLTHRFNGQLPTVIVLAKSASGDVGTRSRLKLGRPKPCLKRVSVDKRIRDKRVETPQHPDNRCWNRMTFESFNPDGAPVA